MKPISLAATDFLESHEFRSVYPVTEKSELLLQQIQQEGRIDLWVDYIEELNNQAKKYMEDCANEAAGPF